MPLRSEGDLQGYLKILRDRTKQHERNLDLQKAQLELVRTNAC